MATMMKATKIAMATKLTMVTEIFYHTSLYDPMASGASANPTSQVSLSVILLLWMVGN
jgi:hypothetical protein